MTIKPTKTGKPPQKRKIVILGAGLAGLACAYELARKQHEVLVLEGRDRVGGRIETLRQPFTKGLFAEAGAYFICAAHEWTMSYIKELLSESELAPFKRTGKQPTIRYFVDGARSETLPKQSPVGAMLAKYIFGQQGNLVRELMSPLPSGAPNWPPSSMTDLSFFDYLKAKNPQTWNQDKRYLFPLFKPWWGELNTVSALAVRRDAVTVLYPGPSVPWYTLRRGMDSFPEAFALKISTLPNAKIQTGSKVVEIEQTTTPLAITYEQGGKRITVQADYLVCAIPFTTLRKLKISPELPTDKRTIIDNLSYNSVARVYLQFDKRIWHPRTNNGTTFTDLRIGNLIDSTYTQPGRSGILSCYVAGDHARALQRMDPEDRITHVKKQMEKVYKGISTHFIKGAGTSKCWDEDEWALGAYARFGPTELNKYSRTTIIRPEGHIHFAGDHTSPWPGWMRGALESGHRAAREIDPTIDPRITNMS